MELLYRRKRRLGDLLIDARVITEADLKLALSEQKKTGNKLGETLVDLGITNEIEIAKALQQQLKLDMVILSERVIDSEIIGLVNEKILRRYTMIPFEYKKNSPNVLRVAMANPLDMSAIDDIAIITNCQIETVIATTQDIQSALDRYYGNIEVMKVAERFTKEREVLLQTNTTPVDTSDELDSSPIVVLVRTIVEQGVRQRASDIHIEALVSTMRVRYRVDGVLDQGRTYNLNLLSAITARIKILSGMDISEKRKPQDGRMTMVVDRKEYDIRTSILPTAYGEKTVLRLALKQGFKKDKRELGFTKHDLECFDKMLANPHGIIIVTGPTGSGKSTTLYTAMNELNRVGVNIITVEDPVEANIDGVNQVQVNNKADLTFASALRSILRQDPDIIMIGEIRDSETASIAVKASITGHLVCSTLHTNSAAGTIMRLIDMGVEPYLVADSLTGIIAQRLVRVLCSYCKKPHIANSFEKEQLGIRTDNDIQIYEPCGCMKCNNVGYHGRIGIYEMMNLSPRLRLAINHKMLSEDINRIAQEEGMKTLHQRAVEIVLEGTTSLEEIRRLSIEADDFIELHEEGMEHVMPMTES